MAPIKSGRHVTFRPFAEVRVIRDNDSESNVSGSESAGSTGSCVSYNVDDYYSKPVKLNQVLLKKPGLVKKKKVPEFDLNESTVAHVGQCEPWKETEEPVDKVDEGNLKNYIESMWKKPISLNSFLNEAHLSDELELDRIDSSDPEMIAIPPAKKKKLLTKKARFFHKLLMKRKEKKSRDDEFCFKYAEKLYMFISRAKKGKTTKSILSEDNEKPDDNKTSASFLEERLQLTNIRFDTCKLDFQLKAAIRHRIRTGKLDHKVKMAYEVIIDNYNSALGPHFFGLFHHVHDRNFKDLEASFLLNQW
ncbi:hypothetical protein L5515_018642 [Caenorhabditis briggsae]|uniref:Uncharacterized protein n=1 Tax=Caenorhabditis briggsae TaxID=6238 RepID=A0AAE9FHG9_CAEBR|nr:hypothetical protein L5515_018642 [Caenorhabditis briggsae]